MIGIIDKYCTTDKEDITHEGRYLHIPISEVFEPRDGCPICRMRDMLEDRMATYITGAAMMNRMCALKPIVWASARIISTRFSPVEAVFPWR